MQIVNVVLGALNLSWENYQGGSAGLFFQHPAHSLYLILSPLIESLPEIELLCACKAEGCGMGDVLEQDGNQECSRSGTGRVAHQQLPLVCVHHPSCNTSAATSLLQRGHNSPFHPGLVAASQSSQF